MHNLDITDGKVNFASHREPAWHGLGTVFEDEVTDYRKMLVLANLANWNVRLRELDSDARRDVETFEVVRDNPADGGLDRLGVVGSRYTVIQNEQAFEFLQSLNDGASWETAGAIKGGAVVFGSIVLEREVILDPNGVGDVVKSYILVSHSFDGSTPVQASIVMVRVVCQNTFDMAMQGAKQTIKVRHTMNAEANMKAKAEVFRGANAYIDAAEKEQRELLAKSVTNEQFNKVLFTVFPKPENDVKGAVKKWENAIEIPTQAWKAEANAGIRFTGWGAVNALTEASQWGRRLRGKDDAGEPTEAALENFFAAGAGFDGPTKAGRDKALALVKAL